jgi:hypothetical protein
MNPKFLRLFFIFTTSLFFSSLIFANTKTDAQINQTTTFQGIKLPYKLNLENKKLTLNGMGMREKFFIDLYVSSLYLERSETNASRILKSKRSSAIQLNIVSGFITNEKMKSAIMNGFKQATNDKIGPIQVQIDEFMTLFDSIKKGDQFTLLSKPNKGITAYKNGVKQTSIKGDKFRNALFKIWLGDNPIQSDLKESMLKGTP